MSAQVASTRQRWGILIASAPPADLPIIMSTLAGALHSGADVSVFLMDDGVGYALHACMQSLLQEGVEVALCAMDAEARGLDCAAAAAAGVSLGSQMDHARLLRTSDRFLSFT